jgi:YbbR domain-containing protein
MDKLLEKDAVIRIMALLIAVLLWFQASSAQNPYVERTLDGVQIRLQNVEQGFTPMGDIQPATVRVRLSGPQHLVAGLSARDINAYIDLDDLEAGTYTRTVRFIEPPGVRIIEVAPATAEVVLEAIVRKTFQLSIVQQGLPAIGHSVGKVTFTPTEVSIEGAASVVGSITNAAVVVDVNSVRESFERNVSVNVFDAQGNVVHGVNISPSAVAVTIEVVQAQADKQVVINPSLAGEPAEGYQIAEVILEPTRVRITGPQETVEATEAVATEVIDISGAREDIVISVGLQLPSGLAIVEPTSFRVTIRIVEIETPEPQEPPEE